MKRSEKLNQIYYDCMRELYANAKDKDGNNGDFDKLIANAEKDAQGRLVIPYMDYYLPKEQFDAIFAKHCEVRGVNEYMKKGLRFNIYLGASPTSHNDGRFND